MILVISAPEDIHAQAVLKELARRGIAARLLNFSEFPMRMSVTGSFDNNGHHDFVLTFANGAKVPMSDVSAVWWRRPQPFGVPAEVKDPVHRQFAYTESATVFQGIWQSSRALWINDVMRDAAAAHKPWQLSLAKEIGLTIPETLITNDPDEAKAFWQRFPGEVIYKPFLQNAHAWRETRILRPEEEAMAGAVRLAPVLFQRYIPGQADLRVTVIGDRLFAAAADLGQARYEADVRLNNDIPYQRHELPGDVEDKLFTLMRRLGLEYGAIDLRLTPDGEYFFFEVNPAGQFLYVEYATGQPIAAALADRLAAGAA